MADRSFMPAIRLGGKEFQQGMVVMGICSRGHTGWPEVPENLLGYWPNHPEN